MIIMANYIARTKDGYLIERIYFDSSGFGTVLALIYRGVSFDYPWMWAWAYRFEDGKWGQGHYDYDTEASAIKALKSAYPNAKSVNPQAIVNVETRGDSFGRFTNMVNARAKMFHVAKHRGEDVYITDCIGKNICGARYDPQSRICYMSKPNTKDMWRVYADGHYKKL